MIIPQVKPADREPLIPMSVNLNSAVRAEERRAFDEEVQAKQAMAEAEEQAEKAMAKVRWCYCRGGSCVSSPHTPLFLS